MRKGIDEVKVGLLVMGAGAILLVTIFAMLRYNPFQASADSYKVYLKFAGGLERDSIVRFAGMRRGKVTGVGLSPEHPSLIEITLSLQRGTPVKQDSTAKLAALSALGDYYVEITPGSVGAPALQPGRTIRSEETPEFSDLLARINTLSEEASKLVVDLRQNINQISSGANVLLENLNEVTGPRNRKALESTLANANDMMSGANSLITKISPKVDSIATNLQSTTERFVPLAERISEATSRMNSLVEHLDGVVEENRPQIKKDLEGLETTLGNARALMSEITLMLQSNRSDIDAMLENFRRSSENLKEFTDTIKQRPFSLVRIKPKPDRKVPK